MDDVRREPFRRLVILGESTVAGGGWLSKQQYRFADVLKTLIDAIQSEPLHYMNSGIGANAISPRSPGYPKSAKPSAMERYREDVIAHDPDLFVFCYGLNDMRAGMDIADFIEDCRTILRDVKQACAPVTVVTTIYHMTGWNSFPPFDKGSPQLCAEYNDALKGLASETGALMADVWRAQGSADWLIHPDGVHANRVGNLVIAHEIFATLSRRCSGLTASVRHADADTDWTKNTTDARAKAGDPYRQTW